MEGTLPGHAYLTYVFEMCPTLVNMAQKEDYYPKLLQQRRDEKTSPYKLSKAPPDFYGATEIYLEELRELLEKELKGNPMTERVDLIRAQYHKSLAHVSEITNQRLMKIANLAAQAAINGVEVENLLPEEKGLFEEILRELKRFKDHGRTTQNMEKAVPSTPSPTKMAASDSPTKETVLRIVSEGPGLPLETYAKTKLRKEDIVSLPEKEARMLIESKRATAIDMSRCS